MASERISLLGIPLDCVRPEQLEDEIIALVKKPGTKQIVLLSLWDLLFAKIHTEYRQALLNANLVLPISKSLLCGCRFLYGKEPVRYNPFTVIISILGILDAHYKTLYLLGGRKESLMQAERNVRSTFSGLHIVGRYAAFSTQSEKDVVTAIYKASPALVLMSRGVKDNIRWVYRRRNDFFSSIFLWNKDVFDIFSTRKKRVAATVFDKGLEIWIEILKNPLKIFLLLPYIGYVIALISAKLFGEKSRTATIEHDQGMSN